MYSMRASMQESTGVGAFPPFTCAARTCYAKAGGRSRITGIRLCAQFEIHLGRMRVLNVEDVLW